jgi:hypothetical protein
MTVHRMVESKMKRTQAHTCTAHTSASTLAHASTHARASTHAHTHKLARAGDASGTIIRKHTTLPLLTSCRSGSSGAIGASNAGNAGGDGDSGCERRKRCMQRKRLMQHDRHAGDASGTNITKQYFPGYFITFFWNLTGTTL